MTLRFELHCHSDASPDSKSTIQGIVKSCERKGIDAIAITDHDVVFDKSRLKGIESRVLVIPGIEVSSDDDSHIIGLFVTGPVKSRRMIEIIREIHMQKGIAVLVHPFRKWQGFLSDRIPRRQQEIDDVLGEIDCVEIFNAKSTPKENRAAMEYFRNRGIPMLGGSDAHTLNEIGNVLVILECDKGHIREGILKSKGDLIIDRTNSAIDHISYGIRDLGKKSLERAGVREDSGIYPGMREGFVRGVTFVKRALQKK